MCVARIAICRFLIFLSTDLIITCNHASAQRYKLGIPYSPFPFPELRSVVQFTEMRQLQVMAARYRTGDGTGVSPVTLAASCVQDSSQALFIAIAQIKNRFNKTPEIRPWLGANPDDPQTR